MRAGSKQGVLCIASLLLLERSHHSSLARMNFFNLIHHFTDKLGASY